jgi:hypothetical protein
LQKYSWRLVTLQKYSTLARWEWEGYEALSLEKALGLLLLMSRYIMLVVSQQHLPTAIKRRTLASRFQAKREQLKWFQVLLPENQGQNLALTVLLVPHSLDFSCASSSCSSSLSSIAQLLSEVQL